MQLEDQSRQRQGGKTRRLTLAGSRYGECPCCHSSVALYLMDSHLDGCLASSSSSGECQKLHGVSAEELKTVLDHGTCNAAPFPIFVRAKKTVHLVRHGHTRFLPPDTSKNAFDVRLSDLGIQQATKLGQQVAALEPEVILVSPLTRALETLKWASRFPKFGERRMEVTSLHAEHVACAGDVGRSPEVLALEFPWLSFETLDSVWWFSPVEAPNDSTTGIFQCRESMGNLRSRVSAFRRFLLSRSERVLLVVGHSTFFKMFAGCQKRMEHCELVTMRV